MRVTDINPSSSHIIILVPYEFLTSPPSWLTSAFTLSPGGRHADNRTENRLILLADGSYIELIAFINDDPALREGHWWVSAKRIELGILPNKLTNLSPTTTGQALRDRRLGIDLDGRRST